jgi:hypothetical protein
MSYQRRGRPDPVRVARAALTGAAWRTAYDPYERALPELRETAAVAGDQAAQVCADVADYYAWGHPVEGDPDRCRIIKQRLTALAEQIAGHPVAPRPRLAPSKSYNAPLPPQWTNT